MAANAGELVIKIAADYAELSRGLTEVNARLDGMGRKVTSINSIMSSGFSQVGNAVKGLVAAFTLDKILSFGSAIEKTVGDWTDMAENLKLSIEDFQAFQNAAYMAGQSTEAVGTALGKFNVFIGKASEGSKEQIDRLNELEIKIQDVHGVMRPQADLLVEVAQKITGLGEGARRAAAEVAFFGKSGQSVSAILEQWAKGTYELNRAQEELGVRLAPEVARQMDAMADRSALAAKQLEVFFAPFYAAIKTSVIENVTKGLRDFLAIYKDVANAPKIDNQFLGGAEDQAKGMQDSADTLQAKRERARVNRDILLSEKELAAEQAKTPGGSPRIDALNAKLLMLRGTLVDVNAVLKQFSEAQNVAEGMAEKIREQSRMVAPDGAAGSLLDAPPVPHPGLDAGNKNPGVKGAGDSIADELAKLAAAAEAARKAMADFDKDRKTSFEILKQDLELERSIREKTADLTIKAQRAGASTAGIAAQVRATLTAQDNLKRYEVEAAGAEATTRKLDDGTAAFTKTMADLNKQFATGRLSQIAYDRAAYDAKETMKDQAEQLSQFKGGLEGFNAGIENAARSYVKANDAFAMGGKVFGGFIGVIDQSFDVLAGKSNKTFQQIASDFALMLAKMAMQAAISPIFKAILGSIGGGGGGIDGEIANWSSYGSGGGGGGILSWFSGLFGGNRAAGGDVQPGMTYNVGEHGPERFTPTGAGQITPYRASGDGGGVTVNLDMSQAKGAANPSQALEFGRKVRAAVVDVIQNEQRPGGLLYG